MTTINHWGKWIDSEVPTTGVLSVHELNWDYMDEICLTCEEIQIAHDEQREIDLDYEEDEYWNCDSSHDKIFGDWKKDENGLYEPDKDGEFAAILRESEVQIVWSKFTTKGNPCSPCFPGQISIGKDETGDFLAYDLPEYMKYSIEQ